MLQVLTQREKQRMHKVFMSIFNKTNHALSLGVI